MFVADSPLTVQVTGKCGSVIVRLIPAPRGAGIVAARVPKKVLQMAGIEDVYTCSRGSTKTLGNFVKVCYLVNLSQSYNLTDTTFTNVRTVVVKHPEEILAINCCFSIQVPLYLTRQEASKSLKESRQYSR